MENLQAQRTELLRDSLDEDTPVKSVKEMEEHKVVDENGKIVQVIFDPILKCYYEPSRNLYYEVKDVSTADFKQV